MRIINKNILFEKQTIILCIKRLRKALNYVTILLLMYSVICFKIHILLINHKEINL